MPVKHRQAFTASLAGLAGDFEYAPSWKDAPFACDDHAAGRGNFWLLSARYFSAATYAQPRMRLIPIP
jgi:hypothetical protein